MQKWARLTDNPSPVGPMLEAVMAGITKRAKKASRNGKPRGRGQVSGIGKEDAREMAAGEKTAAGVLDAALILLMSDCLLRASEAVAVNVEDIEAEGTGTITIHRDKTDDSQAAAVSTRTLKRLRAWLKLSGIESGPVFRDLCKGGVSVRNYAMTTASVRSIIKRWAAEAEIDGKKRIASHSMRVGMAQNMAKAGFSVPDIAEAGGWQGPAMPTHYARGALASDSRFAKFLNK